MILQCPQCKRVRLSLDGQWIADGPDLDKIYQYRGRPKPLVCPKCAEASRKRDRTERRLGFIRCCVPGCHREAAINMNSATTWQLKEHGWGQHNGRYYCDAPDCQAAMIEARGLETAERLGDRTHNT